MIAANQEWGLLTGVALLAAFGIVVVLQIRHLQHNQLRILRRLVDLGPMLGDLRREVRRVGNEIEQLVGEISQEYRPREQAPWAQVPWGETEHEAEDESPGSPDEPRVLEEENESAPEFSRTAAKGVYDDWKQTQSPIPEIEGWEISWMRVSGKTSGDDLSPGRHLLSDSESRGDFVRFSPAGGDEGFLFPHPHRALDSDVHSGVYPPMTGAEPDAPVTDGVKVSRQTDGQWVVQ